jgi:hypothetical protein
MGVAVAGGVLLGIAECMTTILFINRCSIVNTQWFGPGFACKK